MNLRYLINNTFRRFTERRHAMAIFKLQNIIICLVRYIFQIFRLLIVYNAI